MKCNECNYKTILEEAGPEHTGSIMCKLTKEEHASFFECNCEHTRIKRDKEARLLSDLNQAERVLTSLKETTNKAHPDIEYIYTTLQEVSTELASDKLEALIKYMEAFL